VFQQECAKVIVSSTGETGLDKSDKLKVELALTLGFSSSNLVSDAQYFESNLRILLSNNASSSSSSSTYVGASLGPLTTGSMYASSTSDTASLGYRSTVISSTSCCRRLASTSGRLTVSQVALCGSPGQKYMYGVS
jgi:hypothetical protein